MRPRCATGSPDSSTAIRFSAISAPSPALRRSRWPASSPTLTVRAASPSSSGLSGLVVLLPLSELAISLINLVVTSQVSPRQLPKLDLRGGIPVSDRTMVVVPAIIDSEARLLSLLDALEVRFFANRDAHLHFALLSDFADADEPTQPHDATLVEAARRRIDELNARHGPDRFFFFHRARQWNARERRWMGAERKRGKLAEFNRLLRGATDTSFVVQHGDTVDPAGDPLRHHARLRLRSCRWKPDGGWSARSRIR